jgi:SNF family Na+-dependent transporter
MKKVLLSTLTTLAVFTVIYLVFAFGAWDINPKYWYPEVRAFCAFFGTSFGFGAFFTTYEILDKKSKNND